MSDDFAALFERSGLTRQATAVLLGYDERQIHRRKSGEARPRPAVLRALRLTLQTVWAGWKDAFRFIDLFAGIGGLRRGFDAIGGRCVFTSEWDRFSAQTYRANHPHDDHDISGDITKIAAADIPDFDLLLAGFPCQPFSIAGVSKKNALARAWLRLRGAGNAVLGRGANFR